MLKPIIRKSHQSSYSIQYEQKTKVRQWSKEKYERNRSKWKQLLENKLHFEENFKNIFHYRF